MAAASRCLAQQYPDMPTGTLNVTLAILPIPLHVVRKILPAKWNVLTRPYRALLPDFPQDMYPVFMQFALDHDIQLEAFNFSFPDFNKAAFSFPFIDLLGDGHTSFTWIPTQLISYNNLAAIAGAELYGQTIYPAKFDPESDPYRYVTRGSSIPVNGSNPHTYVEMQFSPLLDDQDSTTLVSGAQSLQHSLQFNLRAVWSPAVQHKLLPELGPFLQHKNTGSY
ncbi:hypothetical protein QBC37DRAFT_298801 [Rhypophila decipiens]|uniref:Uncharacterized protein n=1 Tax=Rhypophila decipiens TaxID=261697 RepID=A0AAN7B416_9PEZI|nr:hypothetical protein QBC37DRAFT_298801 [Rhypophila decipiens]